MYTLFHSVSGTESRNSWLPEGRRLGRGNPKLVARHSLSASTQAQTLTALNLSGLKGGGGATNTKGDHVESNTEKKLPTQVKHIYYMIEQYSLLLLSCIGSVGIENCVGKSSVRSH